MGEPTASRLDRLIDCDTENIKESKRALVSIEPRSLECLEHAVSAFEQLAESFGKVCECDKHNRIINDWARGLGLRGETAANFLRDAVPIGRASSQDSFGLAKESYHKAVSIIARAQLTLRLGRDFLFGITDLMRLRITPAFGYLRLQAESTGILRLLYEHPEMGEEWLASADYDKGKAFYDKWNREIVERIRAYGLHPDYVRGSNMALHSRASGITMGFLLGEKEKDKPGEIRLLYQEIDDAGMLFIWFGAFLRFHRKLFLKMKDVIPELDDSHVNASSILSFLKLEDLIWSKVVDINARSKGKTIL